MMAGEVDMHYRENGEERVAQLGSGDIFYAGIGAEHVAHPRGEAQILVIEKEGGVLSCLRPSENGNRIIATLINLQEKPCFPTIYSAWPYGYR